MKLKVRLSIIGVEYYLDGKKMLLSQIYEMLIHASMFDELGKLNAVIDGLLMGTSVSKRIGFEYKTTL